MYSLTNLCFLCLARKDGIKSVLSLDEDNILVEKKLECILFELIDFKPEIPKNICVECLKCLNYVFRFRQKCLENLRSLRTYLEEESKYIAAQKCKQEPVNITQDNHLVSDTPKPEEIVVKIEPEVYSTQDSSDESIHEPEFVNINENIDIKDETPTPEAFTKVNITDILETSKKRRGRTIHKCSQCDKTFNKKGNLVAHERVHTGEKPFQCDVCSKCFNQKTHLVLHKRIHTGIKPYECDLCDKKFTKHGHLTSHKRKHSGERPFCCQLCDKSFSHQASLLYHKRTHSNEKNHKCEVCPYKCTTLSNLKLHIKRMHTKVKVGKVVKEVKEFKVETT